MFLSDDHDDGTERDARELIRRADDTLDSDLETIGLYVEEKSVVARDVPGADEPATAIVISAVVGRVAFGDRVQRPDQEAVDGLFDELTESLVADEYEQRRRELGG